MARRKSKLNFVDSLFGGLAQGFQFSQGIQNRNRRLDQFDRQLDFSGETLDINRQELELKKKKLKQLLDQQENLQKMLGGWATRSSRSRFPKICNSSGADCSIPRSRD